MENINFGKWKLLEVVKLPDRGSIRTFYKCQCECGTIKVLYLANIKRSKHPQCLACKINSQCEPIIGKKFSKLTVLSFNHSDKSNKHYNCLCDCGTSRIVNRSDLKKGRIRQCKFCKYNSHKSHGMKGSSIYIIWMGIKARCLNPNNRAYKNYGGRGITICDEWLNFENFYKDMGNRPEGLQIDRIDNNKGYFKENCRWVSAKLNCSNRRNNVNRATNPT